MKKIINIAIDGPSGAGKSTIAKLLAAKLGILYLDTGAMYRAVGLKALNTGVDIADAAAVEKMLVDTKIDVKQEGGVQHVYLDGKDVSVDIRENRVSKAASDISAVPCVRYKMVELQREIAAKCDTVLDGRDIGSAVLPDAKFKFYVTADSKVRAKRRFKELTERGQNVELESLHREIVLRDKQDSEREFSPLKRAADAVVVDTSEMDIEQAVAAIKSIIQSKI